MAYMQQFFDQHLPQYFLSTLKLHQNKKEFFDFNHPLNLYTITLDLLNLAHHQPTNYFTRQWLSSLINKQILISYDNLRNYRIPLQDSDSEITSFLKSSLQYVHNVLLQLLIRLIAIFLECFESQYLNNTSLTLIEDLSNIYPALKTQISINCPQINLNAFLEKYLMLVTASCNSQAALLALETIKTSCNFLGPTEKMMDKIIAQKRYEIEVFQKKIQFSSNQSEEQSDRNSKKTKQNSRNFNEAQLFKRKRFSAKETPNNALRTTKSMMNMQATPLKSTNIGRKFTPKSEKTKGKAIQLRNKDTKSPLKKTALFKKIKKQNKPLERTIYFGETKRFIPKKQTASEDSFNMKDGTLVCLLSQQSSIFQNSKKTEKKFFEQKYDINAPFFFVPQTPRGPSSRGVKSDHRLVPTNLFKVK